MTVTVTVPVERCIVARDLSEPRLHPDGQSLVYASAAGGAAALMLDTLDGRPVRQLTAYPAPRPGRGFGGGCWCWTPDGTAVVYVATDGELWLQPVPHGSVRRVTQHGPDRAAAGPAVTPDGRQVVYIVDEAEVWVAPLDDHGTARRIDDATADFVFDAQPTPDSAGVAWQAWNVPDMPWDASRIERVRFDGGDRRTLQPAGSIQQLRFAPDGVALCVRDDTGWLNVWRGDAPLVEEPFEHAGPSWGMGQRSFVASPDGRRVAFTRNERGFGRLCVVDVDTGRVDEVARGVHGQLSWHGGRLAALRSGARTPTEIVVHEDSSWARRVVAVGPLSGWEDEALAEPDAVEMDAGDGGVLFARLHRADPPGQRLLCWLHGGPTDQWQVTFMPRIAYWRSRGWNVLIPDHRGSTGHGREYQEALRGRWGELDVSDTIAAIAHAHANGWGAPHTTAVVGSSAGGFTALGVAAARPDLVAAAIVAYPVTDLCDLAERSHRFEQHYTTSLIGPLPETEALHRVRSPINFTERLATTPLLVLHGDSDPVVPVEQSIAFVDRCRASGATVELVLYPGEGHGFRNPENQLDEYQRMAAFLAKFLPGG